MGQSKSDSRHVTRLVLSFFEINLDEETVYSLVISVEENDMKIDIKKNHIICGDNLDWLQHVPDESVDLCYIDPPFFSNRNYEVIWGNGYELRAFGDRFAGGISHYVEWMRPRVELIHSKLKKTGAIFLHCDGHASHRLRCLLDDIFGEDNFRNEIIWQRKKGSNSTEKNPRNIGSNTDAIFYYAKTEGHQYRPMYLGYSEDYVRKFYRFEDKHGRYRASDMRSPSYRPNLIYDYKGYRPHPNGWAVSLEKMKALDKNGLLIFPKSKSGRIAKKNYLHEKKGVPLTNLWTDIENIQGSSNEKLGYPTQKPEALIDRILNLASTKGDLVLDCFAGGGTTAKVASDLGRRFIVGDVSPVATKIMAERLLFDCSGTKFEMKNLPQTEDELKGMNGHTFAEVVCEVMGWEVNERKSGDGGVDAWAGDGSPVQIKNHSKTAAGRPDLQKFVGALHGKKAQKGLFVAWEFSKDAMGFIADMKRDHKLEIVPMKCSEVFGGLLLDHSKGKEIEQLYLERRPKNWAKDAAASENKRVLDKAKNAKKKTGKGRAREASSN